MECAVASRILSRTQGQVIPAVGYAYAKIGISSLYNLVIVRVLRNKNAT
ncbi:hypothetical protein [Nostoc sp.]